MDAGLSYNNQQILRGEKQQDFGSVTALRVYTTSTTTSTPSKYFKPVPSSQIY
jgi:hypothetical protein